VKVGVSIPLRIGFCICLKTSPRLGYSFKKIRSHSFTFANVF
jgi:hypothetical protein